MPERSKSMEKNLHIEVLCFGESIIDFLPDRRARLRDVERFTKIVGGAPANVALGLARLGRKAALLGKFGDDEFGHFLRDALEREGVDTSTVIMTHEAPTGFTFISLTMDGERSFMSPRTRTADQMLRPEDISAEHFARADIVLFGTNQMVSSPLREAVFMAMQQARRHGCFVTFDPNIRHHLWADKDEIIPCVRRAVKMVDLVKLNDEEIDFLGHGRMSAAQIYHEWLKPEGVTALIATRARGGADVFCGDLTTHVQAPPVDVVDTTGAGDGFVAGVLAALCELTDEAPRRQASTLKAMLIEWEPTQWQSLLGMGCFVGSHVCTTLGATTGLPFAKHVPWTSFNLHGPAPSD
jgi:fructokinase